MQGGRPDAKGQRSDRCRALAFVIDVHGPAAINLDGRRRSARQREMSWRSREPMFQVCEQRRAMLLAGRDEGQEAI